MGRRTANSGAVFQKRVRPRAEAQEKSYAGLDHNSNEIYQESDSIVSRNGVYIFGIFLFVVSGLVVFGLTYGALQGMAIILAVAVAAVLTSAVRINTHWERVIVLRFGRYHRTVDSGLYFIIPFVEHAAVRVDQRVRVTTFFAEEALTQDLVPVDVDAVLFWVVWDPTKACMETQNYAEAVTRSAQTALRDSIGTLEL